MMTVVQGPSSKLIEEWAETGEKDGISGCMFWLNLTMPHHAAFVQAHILHVADKTKCDLEDGVARLKICEGVDQEKETWRLLKKHQDERNKWRSGVGPLP